VGIRTGDNRPVADGQAKMVFLGFGKYARADKIYALEPLPPEERGSGKRTRVWIDGVAEPVIASRTERTILLEMGLDAAAAGRVLDEALDLANRLVGQAESGKVDLGDLSRRARRVLEQTTSAGEADQLF
jgi:hypothetical protein